MNYSQSLDSLASLGHELRGMKFSLSTIRTILESLGRPERRYATAIVAGTNGKGSTAAMLASVVERAGCRTGLYTSPHLLRVNERIRVNGDEISDDDFARCFTQVWDAADGLLAETKLAARPSFFEYLTASAFLHFASVPVDFAVLEVGMGGRLDATNVTEPRVAVLTNIALDHQQFLGSTIAAIAAEKAGVITAGRPVVSSVEHPEAREVIRSRAAELGAPLVETAERARVTNLRAREGRYEFDLEMDGDFFPGLKAPLRGRFQVKNAVAAAAAAQQLARQGWKISAATIHEGLLRSRWPGRLEIVSERPLLVLDGAHNPAAAREIAAFAREEWAGRRLRLIYASMRDKAMGEISEMLFPLADKVYLTQPPQARAARPEEILAAAKRLPADVVLEPHPARALESAIAESEPQDVILAAGSLFLVGEIKKALLGNPPAARQLAAQAATSERR
jgi:dihydrofolate synthase / folylpolyglutamate synthase